MLVSISLHASSRIYPGRHTYKKLTRGPKNVTPSMSSKHSQLPSSWQTPLRLQSVSSSPMGIGGGRIGLDLLVKRCVDKTQTNSDAANTSSCTSNHSHSLQEMLTSAFEITPAQTCHCPSTSSMSKTSVSSLRSNQGQSESSCLDLRR